MKEFRKNDRIRFLLLTATLLFASSITLCRMRVFQKNSNTLGTNTKRVALVNSIDFNDFVLATQSSEKSSENNPRYISMKGPRKRVVHGNVMAPSGITIYLSDPTSDSVYSLDYMFLASIWDRDTTYDEILQQAADKNGLISASYAKVSIQRKLKGNNVTVIFHNSPKTASSTLRKACMETQYDTCNLPRKPESMKWPEGYRTPKRLTQLFGECPETRHFCVQDVRGPITRNYTNFYDTRTFLHMFPWRSYDEWALSALKQISYRDGEEGCREMDELLDRCMPHKWELNFEKYTKFILSEFIASFGRVRSMKRKGVNDRHHILIHNYLQLDETLTWLHDTCGVPLLPGTGMRINSERHDESCRGEKRVMRKFHECFSGELAGLH